MNYSDHLQDQRKRLGLTQEQAAEKVGISATEYKDQEHDRADTSTPERFGVLVALGMDAEQAMEIARSPDMFSLAEMSTAMERAADDPFVREEDNAFILVSRRQDGHEYPILKIKVKTAEHVLGWIDHLGAKTWVTRTHLRMFASMAARHLGLTIHPLP